MRILFLTLCGLSPVVAQTKIVLMSDVHYYCGATTNDGKGDSYLCSDSIRAMWNQVRAQSPDHIAISGDLSSYGTIAEYLTGIWVRSATSVAAGSHTITAGASPGNGNFYIAGTDAFTGGPFVPSRTMWAAIEEETPANFEFAEVTGFAADGTAATITFAKAHTAPFTVRICDLGPVMDYHHAGKVSAIIGNHDTGSGQLAFCTNTAVYPWGIACPYSWSYTTEFQALANAFPDTVGSAAGVPSGGTQTGGWWTKQINSWMTIIGGRWDNSLYGGTQETALHATLNTCPSRWCIAMIHAAPYGSCTGFGQYRNQLWLAQGGVDMETSGHCHAYERDTASDYSGGRQIPFLINGWGAGATDTDSGTCTGCTKMASVYSSASTYGFVAVQADSHRLRAQAIDHTGAVRDSWTLEKAGVVLRGAVALRAMATR